MKQLQHLPLVTSQSLSACRRDLVERAGPVLLDYLLDRDQSSLGEAARLHGQISATQACRVQKKHEVRLLDRRKVRQQNQPRRLVDERQ